MIEDLVQIRQLYARYAWAIDERCDEDWLNCFAEDGSIEGQPFGRFQGRAELIRFLEKYKSTYKISQVRHINSNLLIEVNGNEAEGRCYMLHCLTHRGQSQVSGIGVYRDQLRQVGGAWLFASRRVVWDYSGTWT